MAEATPEKAANTQAPSIEHRPLLFERIAAVLIGTAVILTGLYLVVRNTPFSDPNLVVVMRVTLSVATGIFGAVLPGALEVSWKVNKNAVRATGAVGLFVITFFGTPKVLPALDDGISRLLPALEQAVQGLNEAVNLLRRSVEGRSIESQKKQQIDAVLTDAGTLQKRSAEAIDEYRQVDLHAPLSVLKKQRSRAKVYDLIAEIGHATGRLRDLANQTDPAPARPDVPTEQPTVPVPAPHSPAISNALVTPPAGTNAPPAKPGSGPVQKPGSAGVAAPAGNSVTPPTSTNGLIVPPAPGNLRISNGP